MSLTNNTTQRFRRPPAGLSLPEAMGALLEAQKKSWKILSDGYASRSSVQLRKVACNGFDVTLQFNPGRMASTSAPVDAESIKKRSCFLCVENLPTEQEGLRYGDDFVILCNPAPIFDQHFTVSNLHHRPQVLEPFIQRMLSLAKDLSPSFGIFYNGPRCGASAPDHMHFQAYPASRIPVEQDAIESSRRGRQVASDEIDAFLLSDFGRTAVVLEGKNSERIASVLTKLLKALRQFTISEEEPMVNLLCSSSGELWRLILFPRQKHRPDDFFRKDDRRILVSPAAVDMGGLIITPSARDFQRLNASTIEGIFSEVSLDAEAVWHILEELR